MNNHGRVFLKPRKARPFFARHPWVFESSILRIEGNVAAGDPVELLTSEGQFVARGLYNPASAIRVRLYRWDDGTIDDTFWYQSLEQAARLRTEVLGLGGPRAAYRLVFSEGDGLSGLTVDRYGDYLVAQFTSLALFMRKGVILDALSKITGARGIVVKTDRGMAAAEGLRSGEEETVGEVPDGPVQIVENELLYEFDVRRGQKTGFYLDQTANRRVVAGFCREKRVLDLFCYSGGFALNAARAGASSVLGVDSSPFAIELARHNAAINQIQSATFEPGDVHDVLVRLRSESALFDVVICDPPKFARQAKDVEHALKGYLRLNVAALDVLRPGGILVTCSCSGHVDRELFAEVIGSASEHARRSIQILETRGQAPDHPVAASCLETEYLKCLICRA